MKSPMMSSVGWLNAKNLLAAVSGVRERKAAELRPPFIESREEIAVHAMIPFMQGAPVSPLDGSDISTKF